MTDYTIVKDDVLNTKEDWLRKFDEGAKETLLAHFGHNAAKAWKKLGGAGMINYAQAHNDHTGKRYDTYNPHWVPCPAPVKGEDGKFTKRCGYCIEAKGKASTPEAAAHMEIEHRDWWYDANKSTSTAADGTIIERPPKTFEVIFPRWKETGEKEFASQYEKSLDDAKKAYRLKKSGVIKAVEEEHKAEIEEAVDEVKRGPGRPKAVNKGF
jgi:hypothetical protein